MRIISGIYKGKILQAPKNLPVRPTTDFAKESLFNILNNQYYFQDLTMLDLFSGTGNISYEFASRGAKSIVAVDSHLGCVRFINKIASELDFPISTNKNDVFKFLKNHKASYDIIFADPPYNFSEEEFSKIAILAFENELLNKGGLLIIEHSKHTELSNTIGFKNARRYGGSVFSFFEN